MHPNPVFSKFWVLSLAVALTSPLGMALAEDGASPVSDALAGASAEAASDLAVEGAQPAHVGRRLFAPRRRWNETTEEVQERVAAEKAVEKERRDAEEAREKAAMEQVAKQAAAKEAKDLAGGIVTQVPKEQTLSLIVNKAGFFPKTLYVKRDIPTTLFVTGATNEKTCIFLDDFQVRRQIKSQKIEEIRILPSIPGKYRFYCPSNDSEGTLIVKEFHG
ncbi:MAG: cupredoxin domain-containing protein [Bdellovibrionales bacterium]|nr:cupredoxin domain-containing protein [Bdellovibrionales bacterium]